MEILKDENYVKLIWESKISISKTKASSNNNLKRDYLSFRTVFPLALYNYLDYENNNLYIIQVEKTLFKIVVNNNQFHNNLLILKNNNSNHANNKSSKRMPLKRNIFGNSLLKASKIVKFSLLFNLKNFEEDCYMEFIE